MSSTDSGPIGRPGTITCTVKWPGPGSGLHTGDKVRITLLDSTPSPLSPERTLNKQYLGRGANRFAWQAQSDGRYYAALLSDYFTMQDRGTDEIVTAILDSLADDPAIRSRIIGHHALLTGVQNKRKLSIWLTDLAAIDFAQLRLLSAGTHLLERAGRRFQLTSHGTPGHGAVSVHYLTPPARLLADLSARRTSSDREREVFWRDLALANLAITLPPEDHALLNEPSRVLDPEAGRLIRTGGQDHTVTLIRQHEGYSSPEDLAFAALIGGRRLPRTHEDVKAAFQRLVEPANEVFHFGRLIEEMAFDTGDLLPGRTRWQAGSEPHLDELQNLAASCTREKPEDRPSWTQVVDTLAALCEKVEYIPLIIPELPEPQVTKSDQPHDDAGRRTPAPERPAPPEPTNADASRQPDPETDEPSAAERTTRPSPHRPASSQPHTPASASRADPGQIWYCQFGSGPRQVLTIDSVKTVAVGRHHCYALRFDGTIWITGDFHGFGQRTRAGPTPRWRRLLNMEGIVTISASGKNLYGLRDDGTVWFAVNGRESAPVRDLSGFIGITTGEHQVFAMRGDGTIWIWNHNRSGAANPAANLVMIPGIRDARAVAVGTSHAYALLANATVIAWGRNFAAQLGNGTSEERTGPEAVLGLTDVAAIAASDNGGYALRADGGLWAWGEHQATRGQPATNHLPLQIAQGGIVYITAYQGWLYACTTGGQVLARQNTCVACLRDTGKTVRPRRMNLPATANSWSDPGNSALSGRPRGGTFQPTVVPGLTSAVPLTLGQLLVVA